MNVLSLFDGMSCGRIALERAGIPVDKYYASELDKYAIKVTQANWPETIQLGDVTKWRDWDIDWSSIDLLIGGSPCQGFSFAGKQLAFDDPRSKLFFVYVDILNHIKSVNHGVKFLLENVKMKKEYLDVISDYLGVAPVFINSSLVSAQNRQRYYWANWEFGQPEDKNILMSDVVESGFYSTRDKSYCLDANYGKGTNFRRYFFCGSRQLVLEDGYHPGKITKENANEVMHKDGNKWRKLNINECELLQNVPVNYVSDCGIPKTEKYKVLGNGWTVDVIAHIFKSMLGRCAKQVVKARLVAKNGGVFYGENSCLNPQEICPRDEMGFKSGNGYYLCNNICKQTNHAEVNAIKLAGEHSVGSIIYLSGHEHSCCNCSEYAKEKGVKDILIE